MKSNQLSHCVIIETIVVNDTTKFETKNDATMKLRANIYILVVETQLNFYP